MYKKDSIIYNTDPDWFSTLEKNNIISGVNFWRLDKRKLHLVDGAKFYFKLRGQNFIVGRGRYREIKILKIGEAWEKYGINNGAESYTEFKNKLREVFEKYGDTCLINCIILDQIEYLDPSSYFELTDRVFPPQIPAGKNPSLLLAKNLDIHFNLNITLLV